MGLLPEENPVTSISSPSPNGEGPTPGAFADVTLSVKILSPVAAVVKILFDDATILICPESPPEVFPLFEVTVYSVAVPLKLPAPKP